MTGSSSRIRRQMVRRQMGIGAYRLAMDLRQRRYELLPLDLLIPLTFCVRDLEKMAQLRTLRRAEQQEISRRLVEKCLERCGLRLPSAVPSAWAGLAFGGGCPSHERSARLGASGGAYVRTFAHEFDRLLAGLSPRAGRRIIEHLPAVFEKV
jgi:hypothetical protein